MNKEDEAMPDILENLRKTTKKYQDSDVKFLSEMSLLDAKMAKIMNSLPELTEDALPKTLKSIQDIVAKSEKLSKKMSHETIKLGKERDAIFCSIKIQNVQSNFSQETYELMLVSQKRRNTELAGSDQTQKFKQIQEEIERLQNIGASHSKLIEDILRDDGRAKQTIATCQRLINVFDQRKHGHGSAQLENIHKLIENCEKGDGVLHFHIQNLENEIKNLMGTEFKYTDACRKAMIDELKAHSNALQQDTYDIEKLLIEMQRAEKLSSKRPSTKKTPRF